MHSQALYLSTPYNEYTVAEVCLYEQCSDSNFLIQTKVFHYFYILEVLSNLEDEYGHLKI